MEHILLKKIEKGKDNLSAKIQEKKNYLGEFRERVIKALTIDEVNEKLIYKEIENALQDKKAYKILLSNKIDIKKAKKYILLAKKYKKSCQKVDSLNQEGDIGLIVCSKDSYSQDENRELVIQSKLDMIRERGLPDIYFQALGQKISPKYMKIIKEKIPELADEYQEMGIIERIFGMKCPIFEKIGGKKYD